MSSKPPITPYTELDDVRLVWSVVPRDLHMDKLYKVDIHDVSVIGYICSIIVKSPAFLVRHASLTAQLYGILKNIKWRSMPKSELAALDAATQFEYKLYSYMLYLITTLVPGASQNKNSFETTTPSDFVNNFKRFVERVHRRRAHIFKPQKDDVVPPETYAATLNYMQRESNRIYELRQDPIALDKTIVALENYIQFALLHHHIIKRWTCIDVIEDMKDLYGGIIEPFNRPVLPSFHVKSGLITLLASLELMYPGDYPTTESLVQWGRLHLGRWRICSREEVVAPSYDEEALHRAIDESVVDMSGNSL